MPFKLLWCPLLKAHMTYVTDLEDRVIRVICYEYEDASRTCRIKREARSDGLPAQLCDARLLAEIRSRSVQLSERT